jgi:hypothetical protein
MGISRSLSSQHSVYFSRTCECFFLEAEMAEWQCVEPSMLEEKPPWLPMTDKTLVVLQAPAEDTVIFPHVDVCLAIAWLAADKSIIAGHVPAQWDSTSLPDEAGCAKRVIAEMEKLRKGAIDCVVTLGDRDWKRTVDSMTEGLKPKQFLKIWKNIPGGADLRLDGPNKKISVHATRTRQQVKEWTYDGVPNKDEPVTYTTPVLFQLAENLKNDFKDTPFKGMEETRFHSLCAQKDRQEITENFKWLFQKHGRCTEFWAPLHSTLEGDLIFKLADGEKCSFHVVVAESLKVKGRYQIKEMTLKPGSQFYAEQHGRSMEFARR